jgi:hypothetical protein
MLERMASIPDELDVSMRFVACELNEPNNLPKLISHLWIFDELESHAMI